MHMKNKTHKAQPALTNEEIIDNLAGTTGLSRQQVGGLLAELANLVKKSLDQGPDEFTLPGLLKLRIVRKAAREARTELDPVTKRETVHAGEPARHVLQVVPSRELRDIVAYRFD
jgi:nucleoid DNA-binding protein